MQRTDEDRRLVELAEGELDDLSRVAASGTPGRVNRELVARLGDRLLPELFPTDVGGRRPDVVSARTLCVLREALGRLLPVAETALAVQGLGSYPIVLHGTRTQRHRWLPDVVAGRTVVAFALTEPGAGSDAANLATTARRVDDGWSLSGRKAWISHAPDADLQVVFARTGDAGARGVSAFVVPAGVEGLHGTAVDLVAPHWIGHLELDDVVVPRDHLLGEEGAGFRVAMSTLDLFRPSVGAFTVGLAQAALDATLVHTAGREAFGATLRDLQAVSHGVADMAVDLETARLLVYTAADEYDRSGPDITRLAAMAKLHATEAAARVVDRAVQFHGARALEEGHPLAALHREVRAPRIYEGASEVQRSIIARELYRSIG